MTMMMIMVQLHTLFNNSIIFYKFINFWQKASVHYVYNMYCSQCLDYYVAELTFSCITLVPTS